MDNTAYEKQSPKKPQVQERPKEAMDIRSEQTLVAITNKSLQSLTKDDIAFLKARRGYLNPTQLLSYKSILTQTSKEPVKKKNAKTKTKSKKN